MKRTSGIYQIEVKPSGEKYIGSSINIGKRWSNHKCYMKCGTHPNKFLQAAYDKYGMENIEFTVLIEVDKNHLLDVENKCIEEVQPELNQCEIAGKPVWIRREMNTSGCGTESGD